MELLILRVLLTVTNRQTNRHWWFYHRVLSLSRLKMKSSSKLRLAIVFLWMDKAKVNPVSDYLHLNVFRSVLVWAPLGDQRDCCGVDRGKNWTPKCKSVRQSYTKPASHIRHFFILNFSNSSFKICFLDINQNMTLQLKTVWNVFTLLRLLSKCVPWVLYHFKLMGWRHSATRLYCLAVAVLEFKSILNIIPPQINKL